ncbi:MAG: hypothetical protein ACHQ2Z_00990 [Elusimicrobiota bacterium]
MSTKRLKEAKITVDLEIFPIEAVQAAAYTLTDRLFVRLTRRGSKSLSVILKPKASGELGVLAGEFENEMLHESLRLQVSRANQKIREYIVTKALVSAQVPSVAPPAAAAGTEESCPDCAAVEAVKALPAVDAELEKEIEKLLAEIEKGDGGEDPLGVAVPWEEKQGGKVRRAGAPAAEAKAVLKGAPAKAGNS